jgi:ADP-heptose:LPS heptosyltransferase
MAERALLIRLGALGDTLHASSAASLLKKCHPQMEIDFLAARGLADLFTMIPAISSVYTLPFRRVPLRVHPWWMPILRCLNRREYRLAYLMETNERFLPLLKGVKAERKIGLTEEERGRAHSSSVPNPVRYQLALWEAGLAAAEICYPELVVRGEQERRSAELIVSLGLDPEAPLVGLHAGNSYQARKAWRKKLRKTDLRSWPCERWEELVSGMHKENRRLQFVLFGGREDRKPNDRIARRLRRDLPGLSLASAAGKTDLPLAAALLQRFSLFVSTDTGPLHMAAALRVPFIGLYGPTRFDETRPYSQDSVGAVLRRSLPCQPCYGTPSQRRCRDNLCMQQIEAREVVKKAKEVNPTVFPS